MRVAPPVLPGSVNAAESPIDRALSLALAEEREAALRWAAAIVKHDPAMPSALCLCARLLGELGRHETAREACRLAVMRAIDFENLPLAVAAVRELERFGGDPAELLETIASSFCKGSARLGEGAPPPPPLPTVDELHPLASVLSGAALVNKATEIIHEAKRKLDAEPEHPGIARLPLFSSLGKEGLLGLCAAFRPIWVAQGSTVIQQGAVGSEAYFVARGELEVRRDREDADPIVLARLSNGAIFGEMALLSRAPRTGSVVTTRPSIVLEVTREALESLAEEQAEVGAELAAHCRARMFQNLVRISDVLAVVPTADRPALVERCQTRSFELSERLIEQDQAPPGLFLIASGEVAVVRRDEGTDGEPLVIATLGPGDVVGEVAMVLRRKANADVIAVHPTVTLLLTTEDFMALVKEHPAVLLELYQIAIKRDAETTSILEEEPSEAEDFDLV
jgi:cAMP-dependent protein kinase regulator